MHTHVYHVGSIENLGSYYSMSSLSEGGILFGNPINLIWNTKSSNTSVPTPFLDYVSVLPPSPAAHDMSEANSLYSLNVPFSPHAVLVIDFDWYLQVHLHHRPQTFLLASGISVAFNSWCAWCTHTS